MNELFESKEEIIGLINRADNQKETIRLTEKFRLLKKERKEFYLTLNELEDIFKWKLRKTVIYKNKIMTFIIKKHLLNIISIIGY